MKIIRIFFLFSVFLLQSSPTFSNSNLLIMGIFPYVSTSKLISHNSSVRNYINENTQYKISFVSSKNIQTYIENTKKYKYDLIFCAPHFGRYLEKNYSYKRVAMTTHKIFGLYLAKKESAIDSIAGLRGKTLSLTPDKTVIHQLVHYQLKKYNLELGKDIKIKKIKTFGNAIYDVLNGDSDVGVTGIKIFKNLPANKKEKLKVIGETKATTGFFLLAKPTIDDVVIREIQNALLSFNKTEASKSYIFSGFKLISDIDAQSLDFHSKIFE